MLTLHETARLIMGALIGKGGTPYIVGGYVRDLKLEVPCKDIDIEVFGLSYDDVLNVVRTLGFKASVVGEQYAVAIVSTPAGQIEIGLPRTETKTGVGHTAFEVVPDPNLTMKEAAERRDLTINALYMDIEGQIFDPHGGLQDLKARILRPVGPKFVDDPLRPIRLARFESYLGFQVHPEALTLSRAVSPEFGSLPAERIFGEIFKMFTKKGAKPSLGIQTLFDVGYITTDRLSELFALRGIPQDPQWHPEGCALTHTLLVMDHAASIADKVGLSKVDKFVLVLSALCHDLGKPITTVFERGRWRSPAHAEKGLLLTQSVMAQLGVPVEKYEGEKVYFHQRVLGLVKYHMTPLSYVGDKVTRTNARRLIARLDKFKITLTDLAYLTSADSLGSMGKGTPRTMIKLLSLAERIKDEPPVLEKLVKGRVFISLGVPQGPRIGELVALCYEQQLQGAFKSLDDGLKYAESIV